jgi:hypothetical protein
MVVGLGIAIHVNSIINSIISLQSQMAMTLSLLEQCRIGIGRLAEEGHVIGGELTTNPIFESNIEPYCYVTFALSSHCKLASQI